MPFEKLLASAHGFCVVCCILVFCVRVKMNVVIGIGFRSVIHKFCKIKLHFHVIEQLRMTVWMPVVMKLVHKLGDSFDVCVFEWRKKKLRPLVYSTACSESDKYKH